MNQRKTEHILTQPKFLYYALMEKQWASQKSEIILASSDNCFCLFIYLSYTIFAQQHHADIEGMSALSSLWLNAQKSDCQTTKSTEKLAAVSDGMREEIDVLRSPLLPRSSSSFDICFRIFNLNSFITEKSRNDT